MNVYRLASARTRPGPRRTARRKTSAASSAAITSIRSIASSPISYLSPGYPSDGREPEARGEQRLGARVHRVGGRVQVDALDVVDPAVALDQTEQLAVEPPSAGRATRRARRSRRTSRSLVVGHPGPGARLRASDRDADRLRSADSVAGHAASPSSVDPARCSPTVSSRTRSGCRSTSTWPSTQWERYVDVLPRARLGRSSRSTPADDCARRRLRRGRRSSCSTISPSSPARGADRGGETAGAERAARPPASTIHRIEAPATLDGGDVLKVDRTVYVGVGGRTDSCRGRPAGAAARAAWLDRRDRCRSARCCTSSRRSPRCPTAP